MKKFVPVLTNNATIWTAKDVKTLKSMRKSKRSLISIATALGRSLDAVRIKANRLGYHVA